MKYLCLVIVDEKKLKALSKRDSQALDDVSMAYDDRLRQSGHFVAAQALEHVSTAATLRLRRGKVSVSDGPFAETKEQVGGFILIEAKDRNEAVELAAKIPALRFGGVEVRPVKELVAAKQPRSSRLSDHQALARPVSRRRRY
ncbi:MAG TPA: YciI family protein [Candidatus Angelobacter sp.]|nr:YciI family protein [Candidatus Angelobacter sp.]